MGLTVGGDCLDFVLLAIIFMMFCKELPNGWRYPLVGGTRGRHFDGINFKPRNLPENAQNPTRQVHLGMKAGFMFHQRNRGAMGVYCKVADI